MGTHRMGPMPLKPLFMGLNMLLLPFSAISHHFGDIWKKSIFWPKMASIEAPKVLFFNFLEICGDPWNGTYAIKTAIYGAKYASGTIFGHPPSFKRYLKKFDFWPQNFFFLCPGAPLPGTLAFPENPDLLCPGVQKPGTQKNPKSRKIKSRIFREIREAGS